MSEEDRFREARETMVREQLEKRHVRDPRVLAAMRRIPRHLFVPPSLREKSYDDGPLAIGLGQTISQPYIVGAMTQMLRLRGGENVLEVGTGSGYQAAVLGLLARTVHTVERHPDLARNAASALDSLGYNNVFIHIGDGSLGWKPGAPYQGILVTAAAPSIPKPLEDQLDDGGRLVLPVGGPGAQELQCWRKIRGLLELELHFQVAFVPLRGQFGWQSSEWNEEN